VAALVAGCGGYGDGESADRGAHPLRKLDRRDRQRARRRERRLFPGPVDARPAVVEGVTDGDTITLSGIGRVRLIGIDTPEVYGGVECYGRAASAFTKRVLPLGRRVEYRLGVEQRDRYGRALAYVWLADGRLFNGLLAERGYATPLTIPPNVEFADSYVAAARRARRAGRGLWSAC
jgi:endonuclease YncB( thermonuclease family)